MVITIQSEDSNNKKNKICHCKEEKVIILFWLCLVILKNKLMNL